MKFDIKNYFEKYKLLVMEPSLFFKSEAREVEYWDILLFFVFFSFLLNALHTIVDLFSGDFSSISGLIITTVLLFIFPFIAVAYMHLFVLLFKGKKGYLGSFRAIVYSNTIGVIYDFVLYLISFGFVGILASLSETSSLSDIWTSLSGSLLFWFLGVLFVLVGIAKLVHIIYLSMISISMYQGISRKNALIAVLIAKFIIWVLIVFVILISVLVLNAIGTTEILSGSSLLI